MTTDEAIKYAQELIATRYYGHAPGDWLDIVLQDHARLVASHAEMAGRVERLARHAANLLGEDMPAGLPVEAQICLALDTILVLRESDTVKPPPPWFTREWCEKWAAREEGHDVSVGGFTPPAAKEE